MAIAKETPKGINTNFGLIQQFSISESYLIRALCFAIFSCPGCLVRGHISIIRSVLIFWFHLQQQDEGAGIEFKHGSWELGGEEHWACAPCGTDGPDYSESRRETRLCEMATMINSRFSRLHKVQSQWKGAKRWHWKMFQIYLLDVNIDHNCIYKLLQTRTMTIKHCIFLVWLLSKIRLITWRCDFGIVSYESTWFEYISRTKAQIHQDFMFQWNCHSFKAHTTKCLSGRNKLWLLIKGLQGKK